MHLTLVTGGARSGKSDLAERMARELREPVTFLATAEPLDAEMAARIARHRELRGPDWTTVERPRGVARAVLEATTPVVLLDCLTLLASNALLDADGRGADLEQAVRDEVRSLLDARSRRGGRLIVVTNEVGLGIVPGTRLGRLYRDALGAANREVAAAADAVVLMVSGIPMYLKEARAGPRIQATLQAPAASTSSDSESFRP
jgi:adenosyl cobinamide kinase/adenosyl cobinamide phosphate guanylyltransferase